MESQNSDALIELSKCVEAVKDSQDAAIDAMQRLGAIRPNDFTVYNNLGAFLLLTRTKYDEVFTPIPEGGRTPILAQAIVHMNIELLTK